MGKTSARLYNLRSGSVLVLVLIVIAAMTIIAFGLAYQTRIEMRLAKSSAQEAKLRHLALSGIEACKAILCENELTAAQTAKVCRFYCPVGYPALFEQLELPENQAVRIVFLIQAENSLLDLNLSDSAAWENLDSFDREKRACILDWIDSDSDTNPDGAETDYYNDLEAPYECKNAPLVCLKEMLLVKNITRSNYLGRIAQDVIAGADDIEHLLYKDSAYPLPLAAAFTTYGQAKLNINTAPGRILAALPGLDAQAIDGVIAFRSGPDGLEDTEDDRVLENVDDILQMEGVADLHRELLSQYCCFNSDTFRVFSYATLADRACFMMATVRVAESKPEIICVERLL